MDLSRYKGESRDFEKVDFLKAKTLGKGGTIKILNVREAPRQMQYSDLLIDCALGKTKYVLGVKYEDVLLQQLISELGENTDKWKNKSVKLVTIDYVVKKGKNRGKKTKLINVA